MKAEDFEDKKRRNGNFSGRVKTERGLAKKETPWEDDEMEPSPEANMDDPAFWSGYLYAKREKEADE